MAAPANEIDLTKLSMDQLNGLKTQHEQVLVHVCVCTRVFVTTSAAVVTLVNANLARTEVVNAVSGFKPSCSRVLVFGVVVARVRACVRDRK